MTNPEKPQGKVEEFVGELRDRIQNPNRYIDHWCTKRHKMALAACDEIDRLEKDNKRMKNYLQYIYECDGNIEFDELETALKGTKND